ncbi:MAG: P-type conjugative transfer protein TrbL [Rhodospirillales bacterium]|nr:MAG: P-type conjugative transfer protein TrbL [Rhodospirillales bacterium]
MGHYRKRQQRRSRAFGLVIKEGHMDTGILNDILRNMDVFLVTALPFLNPDVRYLFNSFLVITILFSGLWLAFGEGGYDIRFFLKKILLIGFFSFLVTNWLYVTDIVIQTFAKLGLKAGAGGGPGITVAEFFSPSSIVDLGLGIARNLFSQIDGLFVGLTTGLGAMILIIIAAVLVVVAFFVIALQVMIALIEFKLVTLAGFILLPFAIFSKTTFLAERVIGYVFAAGIKLFVLAVVVTFGLWVVPSWSVGTLPNLNEAMGVMGASLLLMALSIFAPQAASSLIGGGPSLGIGAAGATALTVGGLGAAGAGATLAGARAAATGGRSAGAAVRAAARIRDDAPLPGAPRGPRPRPELPTRKASAPSTLGRAAATAAYAAPRQGDGGSGMSADLRGE